MAQTKKYRILTFAVMALVLTALLAVSAFADGYEGITGGFGKINGLDPNAEYQAKPVTINPAGDGLVYGTLAKRQLVSGSTTKYEIVNNDNTFDLTPEKNQNLAGLYVVSSDNWESQSDIIYVYGKFAARADLLEPTSASTSTALTGRRTHVDLALNTAWTDSDFLIGYLHRNAYLYNNSYRRADSYVFVDNGFSTQLVKDYRAAKSALAALEETDENYATAYDTLVAAFNAVNSKLTAQMYSYAFTTEEIIPVSEVNKYTFSIFLENATPVSNNYVRFIALVLVDDDGTPVVKPYTFNKKYQISKLAFTSNYDTKLEVDFTTEDGWDEYPTDGYLLGFEIWPFSSKTVTEENKATIFDEYNFTENKAFKLCLRSYIADTYYSIDVPAYETPDVTVDGTVISGLDSGITYKVATYDGAAVGEEVATITGVTSYTLGEGSFALWIPEDEYANASGYTYFEIVKPAYPAPTGLEVQGTTVIGLDDEKTYTVAPYGIDTTGAAAVTGEAVTIPAGESHDLADYFATPVGLYAIFVPEDATHGASDPAVVYVYGDYADRAELGEWEYDGSTPTKFNYSLKYSFTPGYVTHNSHTSDDTKINYKGYKTSYSNGHYLAVTDSTTGKLTTSYSDLETFLLARKVNYTLTSEEIIPVSELNHFKFGLNNSLQSGYAINDIDLEFIALVMNDAGEIEEYTWSKHYNYTYVAPTSTYSVPFTVNFAEADGWDANGNPTEGYLVAFVIKPFNNLYDGCATKPGEAYTRLNFNFYTPLEGGYSIDEPELPVVETTAEITGVQFQLDGTINIKLPYTCEDNTVVDLALTSKNALSGTSYKAEKVDGAFIIKVLPKDAHTLELTYKLIEDGTVADTDTISVPAIVDSYLENQEYASVHNLVEALAEYCEYAYYYFNGEEDAVEEVELKDTEFVASAAPTKTGTLDGITPHSISLILEETVTLRHYFVVSKDLDLATVTVTATIGGENVTASLVEATNVAEGAENRYAYVDIENIPAHNLGAETVVTVNGTITINCSAVGYVYKAQNDSDSELANLAKAIANYAYEAKNYKAN